MYTLGINATFHDCAACLVRDGVVIAAAEEERFTRIKHGKRPLPFTVWQLPFHAIDFCLERAGITLAGVDHVAYAFDPGILPEPLAQLAHQAAIAMPLQPSALPREAGRDPWDQLLVAYVMNAPGQLVDGAPHHLRARLAGVRREGSFRWHWVPHHLAHQASAFLACPFDDCAVMTLDGRGERSSGCTGVVRGNRYEQLAEFPLESSLGLLYERLTTWLGFEHASDEYKVMALASYGTAAHAASCREMVRWNEDAARIEIAVPELETLFGPPRARGEVLEERHFDLAASMQLALEETVLALARWLHRQTGTDALCLAGGVALNCVMNGRLRDEGPFSQVWVQPAAGDAGTALGAALWVDSGQRREAGDDHRRWRMEDAFLGPAWDDAQIAELLHASRMPARRLQRVAEEVAGLLAGDRIVGWFHGPMEFGPRALGGRSILASPLSASMQGRLNALKDREDFRPVAPMVTESAAAEWFVNARSAPFMTFVFDVRADKAARIPAACHVDGTARVQTVNPGRQPRVHALLEAFGRLTGVPVLVNTSFNTRGRPIVCTPRDALECFASSPIDALVLGDFLLEKPV